MTKSILKTLFLAGAFLLVLALLLLSGPGSHQAPAAANQSYIVQGRDIEQVVQLVQKYNGTVTSRLSIIGGVGAILPVNQVSRLQAEPDITNVMPNAEVRLASETAGNIQGGRATADYSEVVDANDVWAQGVTGKGVTVAVLDTGIKSTLSGLQKDTNNTNRVVGWQDFIGPKPNQQPEDRHGHGTHVAGITANSDTGDDGIWNGIAPDVNLVGVRVLNDEGAGTYETVIQGIQWVVDNKDLYDIKVMNLSIVASPQSPYWADPMDQAVMRAWAEGITVVAAAGNSGPAPMTISVPGNTPYIITVGAFTDNFTPNNWSDDYITPFSAAGPTLDAFVKPDVIAPGAHMVSTMLSSATLARNHQSNMVSGNYFKMAGTSQATAVVSGIAALILSQDANLTPDQVKYRIMYGTQLWAERERDNTFKTRYSIWQQGMGRVNAPAAVFAATQDSANRGLDVHADLADPENGYEGYSYYDVTSQEFRLWEDPGTGPGGYTSWAGGYTSWAGGYTSWAGGYTSWAGNEPWTGRYDDPTFIAGYQEGDSPPSNTESTTNQWIDELDWDDARHTYLPVILVER
ncbi:MAG TPA: S8 family peptidase [Anaerolineae bacterium]